MRTVALLIIVFCGTSHAGEEAKSLLDESVKQVATHMKAIRTQAKSYLEKTHKAEKTEEAQEVVIRRLALKMAQIKEGPMELLLRDAKAQKTRELAAKISEAIAKNDLKTLKPVVIENLETRQKQIQNEAVNLLLKMANGNQTPIKVTRTSMVNGKMVTTKLEKGSYEAEELKELSTEYSTVVNHLEHLGQ